LVNLKLGSGNSADFFEDIDWADGPYFMAISLDLNGGSNYTQFGVTELVSVPYALMAENVMNDQVDDADADSTNELQSISWANDTLFLTQGGNVDLSAYDQSSQMMMIQMQLDSTTNALNNQFQAVNAELDADSATFAAGIAANNTAISNVNSNLSSLAAQHSADSAQFVSALSNNATAIAANSADIAAHNSADGDLSATNEIQNISLSNDSLLLTNGGSVMLSAYDQSAAVAALNTELDTDSATFATAINANAVSIAQNSTDIATNASDITANATAISTNTTSIASNTAAIATNTNDIAQNSADIANNASGVSTNASAISNNATNIASNTTAIGNNANDIAQNSADIATNANGVSVNTTNITNHIATDNDTSSSNEIQDLNLTGSVLTITGNANASQINLAPFTGTNTDNQTLGLSGTSLSITGGNSVDLSTIQDGTGTDAQTLALIGDTLSISGGNSIVLPQSGSSDTVGIAGVLAFDNDANENSIRNLTTVTVGQTFNYSNVGATIVTTGNSSNYGVYQISTDSAATNNYGVNGQVSGGQSENIGVRGTASGNASSLDYGVYGAVSGNSNFIKRGVVGFVTGPVSDNDAAVYGIAAGTGDDIALYGRAITTNTGGTNTGLVVNAANADTNRAIHALAGDVIVNDRVGINTNNPSASLDVNGTAIIDTLSTANYMFPVTDGSNGQVMTTDGAGNISWQSPASGSGGTTPWTVSGANIYRDTGTVSIGGPGVTVDKFQVNATNSTFAFYSSGNFKTTGTTGIQNRGIFVTSDGANSGSNVAVLANAVNASSNIALLAANGDVIVNDRIGANEQNPTARIAANDNLIAIQGRSYGSSPNQWENVGVRGEIITDTNQGRGISAMAIGTQSGWAVFGESLTDSENKGVAGYGLSSSTNTSLQNGVYGRAGVTWGETIPGTGNHTGGYFEGFGNGSFNHGVFAMATSYGAASNRGVEGVANSANANSNFGGIFFGTGAISGTNYGVTGVANNSTSTNYAVYGQSSGSGNNQTGVYGYSNGASGFNAGVDGTTIGTGHTNIGTGGYSYGTNTGANKNYGVYGYAQNADTNYGVYATVTGADDVNYGLYSEASGATTNYAGYFMGNVTIAGNLNVTGSMSKGSGTFKIDHPLDPENKYLVHSFVESPEMMNVYNGNISTDASGFATVTLPDYFETANKDFRYQLTVIGTFAQAIVAEEISGNSFVVQTNQPNVKVSWQVTGVRNDNYAQQNRIEPVQEKTGDERGTYLHPEVYGKSSSSALYKKSGRVNVQAKDAANDQEMLQPAPQAVDASSK